MKRATCLVLLLISLCACKTHGLRPPREFYVSEGVKAFLLPPNVFNGELVSVQEIRSSHNDTDHSLTGVVKLNPEGMQVIVLADMARIMTISYTTAGIEYEFSPLIPVSSIEPEYVLFDVQLTYFPLETINTHLPDGLSFREEGGNRVLYRGERKIVEIIRDGDILEFSNIERSYSYKIRQLEN